MSGNVLIPAGVNVGQVAAEADEELLFECFVDHPSFIEIAEPVSPKMVLLGNTGVGKTAILKKIEHQKDSCQTIELDELSLNYVSNSDVIQFLHVIGVPTDHFFQALWKHIICLEYIKLRYRVNNKERSANFWDRLKERFISDSTKQKALKYLEKWEHKFWIEFDETAAEVTKQLEASVSAAASIELEKFRTDAGYAKKLSDVKKQQLQTRLKKFVDADLLSELAAVIKLLSDYETDNNSCNYILIDRLDEDWVDPSLRYRLVRSLIEALKAMRRISDLKVVVALRADLMEKVIQETKEAGFQSEKYSDYACRLSWDSNQLKKLINNRINLVYRRKYTKDNVFFEDLFSDKVKKDKAWNYLVDRTLMRPRDMISFVNFCLEEGKNSNTINQSAVGRAERRYSQGRFEALVDEWRSVYPGIEPSLRVLGGRNASFPVSELMSTDTTNQLVNEFYGHSHFERDPLYGMLDGATSGFAGDGLFRVVIELIERLHLTGAIGVNLAPTEPIHWFYKTNQKLPRNTITTESKIRIHPMLHSALGILGS